MQLRKQKKGSSHLVYRTCGRISTQARAAYKEKTKWRQFWQHNAQLALGRITEPPQENGQVRQKLHRFKILPKLLSQKHWKAQISGHNKQKLKHNFFILLPQYLDLSKMSNARLTFLSFGYMRVIASKSGPESESLKNECFCKLSRCTPDCDECLASQQHNCGTWQPNGICRRKKK